MILLNIMILFGNESLKAQPRFESYKLPEQTKNADIDRDNATVDVEVPYGTDVTSLIAEFKLSKGAVAYVGGVKQDSKETPNDFTNPVVYNLIDEKNGEQQDWVVTVYYAPNTETDFLSYSFPEQADPANIDYNRHTIDIEVVYGTDVRNLVATFELSFGAYATVNWFWVQESGVTSNNFTQPVDYNVIAEDGSTQQTWRVTVTIQPFPGTEILSYSIPDQAGNVSINSENHTVEVAMPYGTDLTDLVSTFTLSPGATAHVGSVRQISGITSNDFTNPVTYTITAIDGVMTQDWIVTVKENPNDESDFLSFSFPEQSGPANINNNQGNIEIETIFGTDLTNLVASFTLSPQAHARVGDIPQESGITLNDFTSSLTYTVTAGDNSTRDWTVDVTEARNAAKIFLSYSLPEQIGFSDIDTTTNSIYVDIAYTSEMDELIASFDLSPQAISTIDGITQESGVTPNDFTEKVTYTVIAGDLSTVEWEVYVNVVPNDGTDFMEFNLSEESSPAIIDANDHTIDIEVEYGVDLSNLIVSFTLSPQAIAFIGTAQQESGITANDFSNEVIYSVHAGDNITIQDWTVNITNRAPYSDTDFISFGIEGQVGNPVIDTLNNEIYILVVDGTNLNGLIASFELSAGANAYVGSIIQESGISSNDFRNSVTYTIVAEDNISQQEWTVFVSIEFDFQYIKEPTVFEVSKEAIQASALAPDFEGIQNVLFHFKKAEDHSWVSLDLIGVNGIYKMDITRDMVGKLGLYYYFEAVDTTGTNIPLPYKQVVLHYDTNYPEIPDLRFGETVNQYQIIAIPLDLVQDNAEDVFDELGEYNIKYWRLFHYGMGETNEYKKRFTTIQPGLGYWLIVRNPVSITTGEGYTVEIDSSNGFEIELQPGWNQIGNPYDMDISWDDVIISNQNLNIRRVKLFNRDTLTESNLIPSFRGGFVFLEGIQAITVNVKPNQVAVNARKQVYVNVDRFNSLDQDSWITGLKISNGVVTNSLSGIGMHPEAELGKDRHDEVLMPIPAEIIPFELAFNHPNELYKKFSLDVIPTADQNIWEFEVKHAGSDQKLSIHWENKYFGDNEYSLLLNHSETETLIDMRTANSYSFGTDGTNHFRIIFGNEDYIKNEVKPKSITFGYGYPNPFGDQVTIPFTLPKSGANYTVNISVFDLKGKMVKQLTNKNYSPGYYAVTWNSLDETQSVSKGIYILKMMVKSNEINTILTRKIIRH